VTHVIQVNSVSSTSAGSFWTGLANFSALLARPPSLVISIVRASNLVYRRCVKVCTILLPPPPPPPPTTTTTTLNDKLSSFTCPCLSGQSSQPQSKGRLISSMPACCRAMSAPAWSIEQAGWNVTRHLEQWQLEWGPCEPAALSPISLCQV